jgi:hypothetical protein
MTENTTPLYRERLWASAWFFLATALVIPASLLVFLPIDPAVGVIVAVLAYGLAVVLLILASPRIEVSAAEFTAGRAIVPLRFVGATTAYREPEATAERGPRLDARAWLVIRGWIAPVVRVEITDEADPTPYWLVSTRHPDELVAALTAAKSATSEREGDPA